jgi:hypothetical protein
MNENNLAKIGNNARIKPSDIEKLTSELLMGENYTIKHNVKIIE